MTVDASSAMQRDLCFTGGAQEAAFRRQRWAASADFPAQWLVCQHCAGA